MIGNVSFHGFFAVRSAKGSLVRSNLVLDSSSTIYRSTKLVPGLTKLFYGEGTEATLSSDVSVELLIGSADRASSPTITIPSPEYVRVQFRFVINPSNPIIVNQLAIGTEEELLFAKTTLEEPFFIDQGELAEIDYVLNVYHGISTTPLEFPILNDSPVFVTPFLSSTLDILTSTIDFFNPNELLDVVAFSTSQVSFTPINEIVYPIISVRVPLNRIELTTTTEVSRCIIPTTNNFLPRNFNALGISVRGRNNLVMVLKLSRIVSVPFRGELDLIFKKKWNQQ